MVKQSRRPSISVWIAAVLAALSGCQPFEYSPYETKLEKPFRDLTARHLARLAQSDKQPAGPFRFAVIADSHLEIDALKAGVRRINSDTSIAFVLAAGDLTQYGIRQEFIRVEERLAGLSVPHLTVIGNHDAQAQGVRIYRNMYGPLDYSFAFRGIRFIVFNTNVWEFTCCVPDYPWLEKEFTQAHGARIFTLAHVPPYGDQFDSAGGRRLANFLARHRVELAIFGHQHNYHLEDITHTGVPYLVVDNLGDRNYARVTVTDSSFSVERIFF